MPRSVIPVLLLMLYSPRSLVSAFDMSLNTNLAVYWGQNSYGATNPSDTANWQQPISFYCQDDSVDIIPIAFVDQFVSTGGLPSVNLANTCSTSDNGAFPGTALPNCAFLASDIQTCQAKGKIVTISLGGATGAAFFTSDAEGEAFAQTIWDLFLGGSSNTRPFGSAVLDGIDMDIEGGSQTGFTAFLTTLRQLMNSGSKSYYITAAPQCPYPDAYIGNTLNAVPFDAVFVQFYNNYCGLTNYNNTNAWNFGTWDNWAKTVSPNAQVKVFIGAPASSSAAGSGYVDSSTMAAIIDQTRSEYTSFGGMMLWDMSQAYANNHYNAAVKEALTGGSGGGGGGATTTTGLPVTSTTPTRTSTTATTTSTAGSSSCAGITPWQSDVAYVGGDQVTYNGDLWSARWWTYDDVPGGPAGVWVDEGSCSTAATAEIVLPSSPGGAAQVTFAIPSYPAIISSVP
ncbi:chitinase [Paxillus involutus ATCC 200175]|uniref:chitinase n=1 Tax=Paxillus involutus ATCC 200175 TaxID=664439 RepID=A0A0C9TYS1_PAXIN|nr:chitinase [Paxillus involutus ATCC 200175]